MVTIQIILSNDIFFYSMPKLVISMPLTRVFWIDLVIYLCVKIDKDIDLGLAVCVYSEMFHYT